MYHMMGVIAWKPGFHQGHLAVHQCPYDNREVKTLLPGHLVLGILNHLSTLQFTMAFV